MPTRQNMPFVPLRKPFFLCLRRSGGLSQEEPVEPVSGFEPLTVRLQGGCSAKLSYTGRRPPRPSAALSLPESRFRALEVVVGYLHVRTGRMRYRGSRQISMLNDIIMRPFMTICSSDWQV